MLNSVLFCLLLECKFTGIKKVEIKRARFGYVTLLLLLCARIKLRDHVTYKALKIFLRRTLLTFSVSRRITGCYYDNAH